MATKAIITDFGRAQIAAALAGNYKITIKGLAYGDANGTPYEPQASYDQLIHQIGVLDVMAKAESGAWTYYYATIPPTVYGITIREIGVVAEDEEGNNRLLIIASVPDTALVESRGGVLKRLPLRFGVTTAIGKVLIVEAPSIVPAFTNDSLGLIQGTQQDGYVYRVDVDDVGYGKVFNWENTFKKVSDEEQVISSVSVYCEDTYSYYRDENESDHLLWHVGGGTIEFGSITTHMHFNTDDSLVTGYGDHITATTPQGEKAVAWLDDLDGFGNAITHYAFNAGSVLPDNGDPDYAYINDLRFGIKSGTRYTDGETTHDLESAVYTTLPAGDENEYNVYIEYNADDEKYQILYKDNTEYRQRQRPQAAEEGDYWLRTLEPLEAYWVHRNVSTGALSFEPTNAVYCYRLTHGTVGCRYAEYEGEIIVDYENHTLTLEDYTIITPENFHWNVLDTGTMEDPGVEKYPLSTMSSGLVAKMPDYAWNGYNVNVRTLQEYQARTLPDVTGHVGQVLMSDGTKAYWTTINAMIENSMANTFYSTGEPVPDPDPVPWTQPTLVANTSAGFIVSIDHNGDHSTSSNTAQLYRCFNPNTGSFSVQNTEQVVNATITMTSTVPLLAQKFNMTVLSGTGTGEAKNIKISALDATNEWVELATLAQIAKSTVGTLDMSSNTTYYSTYKVEYQTTGVAGADKCTVSDLKLTALYIPS